MNPEITPNTQATLLLTAPLIVGNKAEPAKLLTPREFNNLARLLVEHKKTPSDLLDTTSSDWLSACSNPFGPDRLQELLGRSFLLSQAIERWRSCTIWVISRGDPIYPARFKSRLKSKAPPVLYGCGNLNLLEKGGLAVVGSRKVDEALRKYTMNIGALAAEAGLVLVSGAARGIDQSAMNGALQSGGEVVGVMSDSLERAVLAVAHREPLHDETLTLVSPYDPAAGFNVGHAMQRNKLIYALADAGLVVNTDFEKGGTWTGAVEQLDKYRSGPLFVRMGVGDQKGCSALIERGAIPWPTPENGEDLIETLKVAVENPKPFPDQGMLPLFSSDD